MTPTRRAVATGGLALTAAGGWTRRADAVRFGSSFTVTGKNGPFIHQVAGRRFGWSPASGGALGLASDAVNQGKYQQARLRMPYTEAAVSGLLERLRGQWPYAKGAPPRVFILGVDYYNAYSLPDNSIVVAFGLLDHAGSDDEVAFVLGHELSHLLLGHFGDRSAAAQRQQETASRLGQLFLVGSALSGAAGGAAGRLGAAVRDAGATSDMLQFLAGATAEEPHTQAQEDEADAMGFDLSQAAAYSAEDASATVFDTIQADRDRRSQAIDAMKAQLKAQLSQVVSPSTVQSILAGGWSSSNIRQGLFEGAARVALSGAAARGKGPAHRPPAERKRGIAEYSAQAYPAGAPLRDEQHGWLQKVRSTTEFIQARIAVDAVQDAMKARAIHNYAEATSQIGRATRTSFGGAPMVLNEAARLRYDMGDVAGADRLFTRADASPDQTVDGGIDHARMLFEAGQNDRAMRVIQTAIKRFGDDDKPFLSLLIAVSLKDGRQDEADRYLQRCVAYNDADLKHDCELAAGKTADQQAKPDANKPSLPFHLPSLPHL